MTILYGISNCDTVRKTRHWLNERDIAYTFHDFRKDGLNPIQLQHWITALGWEALANKRSTTWRQLPQETRDNMNATLAQVVMEAEPTLIKRPVLEHSSGTVIGFSAERYQQLFQH